jgi:pyruvate-formate lyase-activating enzyme
MNTVNVVFKSLYACAHQCGFCHVLQIPRNISYMSTADVKKTFDDIERIFAGRRVELEMSGGEFTMRKDSGELIKDLRSRQIRWSSLVLDTMGVFLADERLASELGSLFDKANVSVHACDTALHAAISSSRTPFEELEAGLTNIFRFFPAVFTNTSINKFNYDRLPDIARFILQTRKKANRDVPLYCLFYLPVYREYGPANKENSRRIQGEDNTDFLPPPESLAQVRERFAKTRALLATHGVAAVLRDFNLPACIYHAVSGTFPENSFGLPNLMTDCYFTDFEHPLSEMHTLESVYPSKSRRTKTSECERCAVEPVCPGIPEVWLERGYEAAPVKDSEYAAAFPIQLLNQTLFGLFHDAVRMRFLFSRIQLDWKALADSFFDLLRGEADTIAAARDRISHLSATDRAITLARYLRIQGDPDSLLFAALIEAEIGKMAQLV